MVGKGSKSKNFETNDEKAIRAFILVFIKLFLYKHISVHTRARTHIHVKYLKIFLLPFVLRELIFKVGKKKIKKTENEIIESPHK